MELKLFALESITLLSLQFLLFSSRPLISLTRHDFLDQKKGINSYFVQIGASCIFFSLQMTRIVLPQMSKRYFSLNVILWKIIKLPRLKKHCDWSNRVHYNSMATIHSARSLRRIRAFYVNICTQPMSAVIWSLKKSENISQDAVMAEYVPFLSA